MIEPRKEAETEPKLVEYLRSRRLNPIEGVEMRTIQIGSRFYLNAIFIFNCGFDGVGKITHRSKDGIYNVIWEKDDSIPIYKIDEILRYDKIVITESVFDAESINQNIDGVLAITTGSASVRNKQLYLLSYLLKGKDVYIGFDNDEGGNLGWEKIKRELGHLEPTRLSFPYNDLNKFLTEDHRYFRKVIEKQLF